jgi:hypothetical protein
MVMSHVRREDLKGSETGSERELGPAFPEREPLHVGQTSRALSAMLVEISPGVFIRNEEHEEEDGLLERAGITCIVEASDGGDPVGVADSPVERLRLPILGLKGELFVATFRQASTLINQTGDPPSRLLSRVLSGGTKAPSKGGFLVS